MSPKLLPINPLFNICVTSIRTFPRYLLLTFYIHNLVILVASMVTFIIRRHRPLRPFRLTSSEGTKPIRRAVWSLDAIRRIPLLHRVHLIGTIAFCSSPRQVRPFGTVS